MLYACLKAIHLLSLIVWMGGMFFTLACLRPALAAIEGPARVPLMHAVLRRFFGAVGVAIVLMLVSGGWMLAIAGRAYSSRGLGFAMPLDWNVMIGLGLLMIAIFGHIRFGLFTRLKRAAEAKDGPAGAAALGQIRRWVTVNLAIGVVIVVVMRLGASG